MDTDVSAVAVLHDVNRHRGNEVGNASDGHTDFGI